MHKTIIIHINHYWHNESHLLIWLLLFIGVAFKEILSCRGFPAKHITELCTTTAIDTEQDQVEKTCINYFIFI